MSIAMVFQLGRTFPWMIFPGKVMRIAVVFCPACFLFPAANTTAITRPDL
jgi:hypothetical protein